MVFALRGGERHEQPLLPSLLEQGAGRGRPRLRPERVAGDKGYSAAPGHQGGDSHQEG